MDSKKASMPWNTANRPLPRGQARKSARDGWALVRSHLHDIIRMGSQREQTYKNRAFEDFEIEIFEFYNYTFNDRSIFRTCSSLSEFLHYSRVTYQVTSTIYVISIRSLVDRGPSASNPVAAYCVDLILRHFDLNTECREYILPVLRGNHGVRDDANSLSLLDFRSTRWKPASQWCLGFKKPMIQHLYTSGELTNGTVSNFHRGNFYASLVAEEQDIRRAAGVYILTESKGGRRFSFLEDLIRLVKELLPDLGRGHTGPVAIRLEFCKWSIQEVVLHLQHLQRTFCDYSEDDSDLKTSETQHIINLSLLIAQVDRETFRLRQSYSVIKSVSRSYLNVVMDLAYSSALEYKFEELLSRVDRYLMFAEDLGSQIEKELQETKMWAQLDSAERTSQYSLSMLKLSYISQNFSRGIGFLILMFMPGIFVSTLFSTGFFTINDRGTYAVSSTLWIWFAATIPLTIVSLAFIQIGAILQTLKDELKLRSANRRAQDTEMTSFESGVADNTRPGTTNATPEEYRMPAVLESSLALRRKSGKRPEASGFNSSV